MNDASIPSCPKYQFEPGSEDSSASGSVAARVGDNLIEATMVAPGVEKCSSVVGATLLESSRMSTDEGYELKASYKTQ